jgi:hypothetical protein
MFLFWLQFSINDQTHTHHHIMHVKIQNLQKIAGLEPGRNMFYVLCLESIFRSKPIYSTQKVTMNAQKNRLKTHITLLLS